MSDEQDHRIAHGLRQGKTDAWSALYEKYFDRVWHLVARMIGGDGTAVADVVQETFLAAARSARHFEPQRGSLWQWLGGIARNHLGAFFRSRRRDGRVKQGGDLRAAVAEHRAGQLRQSRSDPQGAYAAAETAGRVRDALGRLPGDYQFVLTAHYCEQVPVEEIARLADCSTAAIRSKLARARRAFRVAFDGPATCADDGEMGAHHERA
jgi:RNA polymerase sigma-70 factor (ECF subfamily)